MRTFPYLFIRSSSVLFFQFALFAFSIGIAEAYCETSGGSEVEVVCTNDSQCQEVALAGATGLERLCVAGTVCKIGAVAVAVVPARGTMNAPGALAAIAAGASSGLCISSLGSVDVAKNKILGGYELTGTGLRDLINNVTFAVGVIVGLIFFAMLVMGGIAYMTSAGDEKQLTKAKQQITAGLIGLVIVFMAWWVVKIVGIIFGINILQPSFTGP